MGSHPLRRHVLAASALCSLCALAACADDLLAPPEPGAKFCGAGVVRLEVGQVAVPTGTASGSCKLAPTLGAQYAMSWVDLRAIRASELGPEPSFEPYIVRLSFDADVASASRNADALSSERERRREAFAPTAAHVAPKARAAEGLSQTRPRFRNTPLVLDEVFLLEDELLGLARPARVVRVYANGLVVVRWDVPPVEGFGTFLSQLDSAWALLGDHALPVLRSSFVDALPRSTGAGQMLIIAQQEFEAPMRAMAEVSGDTLFAWLDLLAFPWTSSTRLAQSLAHETTHLYQMMYMHASRPAPGVETLVGASFWAIEGGANLMSYELLRRMSGVAPDANHDWRAAPPTIAASLFQQRAQPAGGVLTDGFDNAMGFMRDLVLRRMLAGESHADALREVSRGVIEGWYGYDGAANRRGLVSRMRARVGADWTPGTALLNWALSYAGDDLTPNPTYQDRASLRVWDLPVTQSYGWRPDAVMTRTTPPQYFFKTYGSPGYARFLDDGNGLHLDVQAFEVPIAWKVLRIR